MTLKCAEVCLKNFSSDDLSRVENKCLTNCFHKHYRYHAYANTLFTFLTADDERSEQIKATQKNYIDYEEEENSAIEEQIRARKQA